MRKEFKKDEKSRQGHKQNIIQLTCLMAVTVMTKNKGKPLVTGLVGVSTITFKKGHTYITLFTFTESFYFEVALTFIIEIYRARYFRDQKCDAYFLCCCLFQFSCSECVLFKI